MEFPLAAAPNGTMWFTWAIGAVVVAVVVVLVLLLMAAAGGARVVADEDALRVRAPLYGRTIPLASIDVGGARVLDLRAPSPHAPRVRTNGVGLPGFLLGWFRLHDGERGFLAVTARDRVTYLPTSEGYALLLSVADPERFLEWMRSAGR